MSTPPLLIIDPGTSHPELECVEWLAREARALGLEALLCLPALPEQVERVAGSLEGSLSAPPFSLEGLQALSAQPLSGLIILGSGASPEHTLPWQEALKAWLRAWLNAQGQDTPVLGLCYGHQLLAHLSGAEIELLWAGDKASGVRRVQLTPEPAHHTPHQAALSDDALSRGGCFELIVSHREGFKRAPKGWRALCVSSTLTRSLPTGEQLSPVEAVEAMKHERSPWWGFQAHLEAVEGFLVNNSVARELPSPYEGHELVRAFLKRCTVL